MSIKRILNHKFLNIFLRYKKIKPAPALDELSIGQAMRLIQDYNFPVSAEEAENIFVVVIPEYNMMGGGVYSLFSIASAVYKLRFKHNYEVLLMTRPNKRRSTYIRQKHFRTDIDVFRLEQIVRCQKAKNVYLHIAEYMIPDIVARLNKETLNYLRSRAHLFVNILNQNIDLMPKPEKLSDLRTLCEQLTQSVAHHAYFSQSVADKYNTPLLLLPAYTDLSNYPSISEEKKQKLIIYSPDEASWKKALLERLVKELPDYELREIRGITFDKFMDLATICRYSITFGEGFDGYLAQPVYQGGVGFAIYNERFFPSDSMRGFINIFESEDDILSNIIHRIREMDKDPDLYKETNRKMMDVYNRLYSWQGYLLSIEALIKRDFEIMPSCSNGSNKPRVDGRKK